MNKKHTKYWIMGAIAVVIIMALSFPLFLGRLRLNSALAQLRKEGIPVTPQEFADKYYKPVPKAENAADILENAAALLKEPEDNGRLISRGFVKSPRYDQKLESELLAEVKKDILNNSDFFEEMEKAENCDSLRFDYNWKDVLNMPTANANGLRSAERAYALKAELAVNDNDSKQAFRELKTMFHFCFLAGQEPTTIGQMVLYSCESTVLDSLERCMNKLSFSASELKFFDESLNKHERLIRSQWPRKILADLAFALAFVEISKFDSGVFKRISTDDEYIIKIIFHHYTGKIHNDLADEIELVKRFMKIPLDVYADRKPKLEKIEEESKKLTSIEMVSATSFCLDIYRKALEIITRLRCAKTACAIQCFRLKYGKLPDNLRQLVPEFLSKVPADPHDGKDLRYVKGDFSVKYEMPQIPKKEKKETKTSASMFGSVGDDITYKTVIAGKKGFYVYSVSKNLVDDKGDTTTTYNYKKKDISFIVIDKKGGK